MVETICYELLKKLAIFTVKICHTIWKKMYLNNAIWSNFTKKYNNIIKNCKIEYRGLKYKHKW